MSGTLKIRFAPDMPPAAVEVVSPDLATVDRLWLSPGDEKSVEVPSEGSFLRVHLASGKIVTLHEPGAMQRTITRDSLRSTRKTPPATRDARPLKVPLKNIRQVKAIALESMAAVDPAAARTPAALLDGGVHVELKRDEGPARVGEIREDGACITFVLPPTELRYILSLGMPGLNVRVRMPGSAREVLVRSDEISGGRRIAAVRVRTHDAAADAISGYMQRGDLYSASSMSDWAEQAEHMLQEKMANPFAAAIGAYLLLRLRRIELLHDWTRNLANRFPHITDTLVIRAWHLIQTRGNEMEIRDFFGKALDSSLPVFTEGLRLLSEGARLLGHDAEAAVEKLNRHAQRALTHSPLTATVQGTPSGTSPFDVDIDYAPPA
ncbi:MAG TPA: hypothetical protein VJ276_25740 [Thermoanaerobaculia bacterium]|nr:hypothetical protein [Thermoanaerobaculia bacterium]